MCGLQLVAALFFFPLGNVGAGAIPGSSPGTSAEGLALLQTRAQVVVSAKSNPSLGPMVSDELAHRGLFQGKYAHYFDHRADVCRCSAELENVTLEQSLSPVDALLLYQHTHKIGRIFEHFNITYWAQGGTLLGAVRNKGIIPHDDDVDLYITENQADQLRTPGSPLLTMFAVNGLSVEVCPSGMGVQWWVRKVGTVRGESPHVDIFALHQDEYGQWRHVGDRYALRKFDADVVEHLEPWPFGSSTILAPDRARSERHLDQVYGTSWRAQAACVETAHACMIIDDAAWDVSGMALPSSPLEDIVGVSQELASGMVAFEQPHRPKAPFLRFPRFKIR